MRAACDCAPSTCATSTATTSPPQRGQRGLPRSVCGLSKRHVFDRATLDGGYDVLVTGHNLDDEAAVLFGNTLRWDIDYLARQLPVLPARERLPEEAAPAARTPHRARDGGVVPRPRHRLPRRRVPDGPRQEAPRLQVGAQRGRARVARLEGPVLFYLGFIERMAPLLAGRSEAAAGGLGGGARAADRRRPATCARSAG